MTKSPYYKNAECINNKEIYDNGAPCHMFNVIGLSLSNTII